MPNWISLEQHLAAAPKKLQRDLHAKLLGKQGVLANNQILAETCRALKAPERVSGWARSLQGWQVQMMGHIYASGARGLSGHELSASILQTERGALVKFLGDATEQIFCYRKRTSQGHYVYYGFQEFAPRFMPQPEPFAEPQALDWASHAHFFDWHVVKILARTMRGALRLGVSGKLPKRDTQAVLESLGLARIPQEEILECEMALALQFLQDRKWLQTQGAVLAPTPAAVGFLQESGIRLSTEILQWWVGERFKGNTEILRSHLLRLEQPSQMSGVLNLFWPFDPTSKPGGKIPRPLLELWILGLVDFAVDGSSMPACRLSTHGREWLGLIVPSIPKHQKSCLPNFEAVLSIDSNPWTLFYTTCLAAPENEDFILKFSLRKEYFLDALHKGVPESFAQELLKWNLPENVETAMSDWLALFSTARMSVGCLLKIKSEDCWQTLAAMPQFLECALESIPGYGFIVKEESAPQILQILRSMGLSPSPLPQEQSAVPFQSAAWSESFALPWPETSETDFSKAPALDAGGAWNSTKYNTEFRKLPLADLEQVLRYALLTNIPLEAEVPPEEHTESTASLSVVSFLVRKLKSRAKIPGVEVELLPGKARRLISYAEIERIRLTRV